MILKPITWLVGLALLGTTPISMSVEDYASKHAAIQGNVKVTGMAGCAGATLCYLWPVDCTVPCGTHPIVFDSAALPDMDRKRLLDCDPAEKKCVVTVIGRNAPNGSLHDIVALAVQWK